MQVSDVRRQVNIIVDATTQNGIVSKCADFLSEEDLQAAVWNPSLAHNAAFPDELYGTFQVCQWTGKSFREKAVEHLTAHPRHAYFVLVIETATAYASYDAYIGILLGRRRKFEELFGEPLTKAHLVAVQSFTNFQRICGVEFSPHTSYEECLQTLEVHMWPSIIAQQLQFANNQEKEEAILFRKAALSGQDAQQNKDIFLAWLQLYLHDSPCDDELVDIVFNFLVKRTIQFTRKVVSSLQSLPNSLALYSALARSATQQGLHYYRRCFSSEVQRNSDLINALFFLKQANEFGDHSLDTLTALGNARKRQNKFIEAQKCYSMALRLYFSQLDAPQKALLLSAIADCYLQANQIDAALRVFETALRHDPNNPEYLTRSRLLCDLAHQRPGSEDLSKVVTRLAALTL